MTDQLISIRDGVGNVRDMRFDDQASSGIVPYHKEDQTQRDALIAKVQEVVDGLSPLLTASQLSATGLASAAKQDQAKTVLDAIAAALGGALQVQGPLTSVELGSAGLASEALQTTGNASLSTIAAKDFATQATLVSLASAVVAAATRDSTDAIVNPDSWTHALAYDGEGNLSTDTATDGIDTWVQTFTYTDGELTAVSAWVKQ
jgi:YD repeat-containing protein